MGRCKGWRDLSEASKGENFPGTQGEEKTKNTIILRVGLGGLEIMGCPSKKIMGGIPSNGQRDKRIR